jgi:hypothetical protein
LNPPLGKYRVIQEKRSIFLEEITNRVILEKVIIFGGECIGHREIKKKVHMNMRLIQNYVFLCEVG